MMPQEMQELRLEAARKAIATVFDAEEIGLESSISDLLGNLMHLCDAEGIDFEERVAMGHFHHDEEREELALAIVFEAEEATKIEAAKKAKK